MSSSSEKENSDISEILRKSKAEPKRKLIHSISDNDSSSPGSSPIRRTTTKNEVVDSSSAGSSPIRRTTTRNVIINLDSDGDDSSDCEIVPTAVLPANGVSPVLTIDVNDDDTDSKESTSEKKQGNTNESGSTPPEQTSNAISKNESSDDERMRPIKRKKCTLNNKKQKRRKKSNHSDNEENSYQKTCVYDSDDEDNDNDLSRKAVPRKKVVDFLDNGNEKEFYTVPTMTEKKLQLIITNRPFNSWFPAVRKFESVKGLKCSLLNNICDMIVAKDIINDILAKCEKMASKTEKNILSTGTLVSKAPALLNTQMTLSNHQVIGLNWLVLMRSESLNSILADEMGLGKTIQVIAFLAYLKENELVQEGYPHLVVVPSSTLNNWNEEFQKWCPTLKISIYHGNQDERRYLRHIWCKNGFGDADVILTTYACATSCHEEKKLFRVKEFNYVIFDEAHMLKNMNTQRYEALFQFNGNFKILLTGTPLQNNLLELMSLLVFLMPDLFKNKISHIKLLFSKCSKTLDEHSSDYEKERVDQAKRIIEPFMLRRLKENVLRDLPTKTISVKKCALTCDQLSKYKQIAEDFKSDMALKDSNCHMVYFMLLRKMANHPLLLRYHFTEDKLQQMAQRLAGDASFKGTNAEYIREDLYFKSDFELNSMCQDMESLQSLNYILPDEYYSDSGKLQVLTPMLHSLKETGHRVLIFSQFIIMLDILEEYCRVHEFSFLRLDGSTQTDERQELINLYNSDQQIFIFLLSTKAGGLGINLTSADTVIIHDVDFNPYNDKQAEDRCHRMGQTRPVNVYKMVSEGTVEEGMHNTAVKKLFLEREVTAGRQEEENPESKSIVQLLQETLGLLESS